MYLKIKEFLMDIIVGMGVLLTLVSVIGMVVWLVVTWWGQVFIFCGICALIWVASLIGKSYREQKRLSHEEHFHSEL